MRWRSHYIARGPDKFDGKLSPEGEGERNAQGYREYDGEFYLAV